MPRSRDNQAVTVDSTKLVIGLMQVRISSPTAAAQTDETATASNLSKDDSLGSLQSAQLTADVTTKEHQSGYPAVTDLTITESSNLAVEVTFEEIGNTLTQEVLDAMLDAIQTGTVYTCSIECVAEFATGGVKSFWIPNAILEPQFNFAPGNDWAGVPVKFTAAIQSGTAAGTDLIYMNDTAGSGGV